MLQLWLLLLLYNPLGSCFPASDMDSEESRKVLGSSVVTSVSVIMDLGNGTKKIFGDAAHESTEKQEEEGNHPMEEMPERYEFYTFNEDGDLVKRLMTLEEIQNLLASDTGMKFPGDLDNSASVFHETSENFYHTPQPSDQVFHTLEPASPDVQEVVANVQSVLAGELASRKNASLSQTTTSTASPSTTTTTTTTTEAPTTTARVTSTSTTTTTRRPPTRRPTTRRPTTRAPTTIRNTRRPPTTGSPFKRTTTTLRASPSRKPITTRHPVRRTTTTSTTTTTTTTTTTAAPTTTIASVQKSEATEQTEKMETTEGTTLTNPTSGPMETTTEMESTNRPSWTMIPLVTVAHTKQQEAFTTEMTTTNSEVEDVTTEEGDPLHELADSVSNVLSQVTHDLTSVVELNDSTEPGDSLPMKEELKDAVKTEMPGSEVVEDDKEMNTETTEMQNDRPLTEAQGLQNKDQSVIDPQSDSSEVTDTEISDDADLVTTERDAMSPLTTEYLHEESSTKSSQTASDSPTTSAGITDVASNTDPTDELEVANTEPVSQSEDTRTTEYDLIELVTHPTTEADNMKTSATPEDSSTIASMDGNVNSKVSTEAPSVETKEVVTDSSQQKEDEPTTKVADNEDDLPPGELTKSAIPLQQLIAGGNKLGDYSTNPNHAGFEAAPQENLGLEVTTIGLGTDMRRFVDLNNDLALRLYAHVTRDLSQRSLVLSPFAVTSLLAMVFLGARGATSGQMNDLLRLDDMVTFNPHLVYMNVTDSVVSSPGLQAAAFVRELFADESKGKVLEFYKARTRAFYDGLVEEVDFEDIADIIRQRTNELVKMQTRAKITEYLRGANLMLRPPLSALSTNFFEGVCNDASTDDRDGEMYFVVLPYIRQRRLVLVPAVVWRGEFMAGYDPQLDATAAEIRFKGKEVSLILVLPGQPGHFNSDGLSRLETRLSTKQAWSGLLRSMVPRRLDIQVPRFAHRSMFNLTAALRRMGIRDLLTPERADLGGINGRHDLYLSDFVQMNEFAPCADDGTGERHVETYPFPQRTGRPLRHWEELETSVWVNEPSTDLPLALRPRQARVPELSNNLKFERPFLYYTRHNPTGLILHMGRFNPRLLP